MENEDVSEEEIEQLKEIYEKFGRIIIYHSFENFARKNLRLFRLGWRPKNVRGNLVWQPASMMNNAKNGANQNY